MLKNIMANTKKKFTDPDAHYYTLKALRSQSVTFPYQNVLFCYQNVSFRPQSDPFRSQSVSFRTNRSNCFMQSVPSKVFGRLREFSLSLSKWRIDNKVESSLGPFISLIIFLFHIPVLFLWNSFNLLGNFEF